MGSWWSSRERDYPSGQSKRRKHNEYWRIDTDEKREANLALQWKKVNILRENLIDDKEKKLKKRIEWENQQADMKKLLEKQDYKMNQVTMVKVGERQQSQGHEETINV